MNATNGLCCCELLLPARAHPAPPLPATADLDHPLDLLPNSQDQGGIIPALQKLSYAGKNLEDAQRTLEQ